MMTQQPELVALGMWSQMARIFCSISKELTPLFDYSFSLLELDLNVFFYFVAAAVEFVYF